MAHRRLDPKLVAFLSQIVRRPCEFTLVELCEIFGIDEGVPVLERLNELSQLMDSFGLGYSPPLNTGGLGTRRIVFVISNNTRSPESVLDEIAQGENHEREFKSSLLYDRRRALHDPGKAPETYKSDIVLGASLKTIAGFMTSGGGILYIGINDQGVVEGIEVDFECLSPKKQNEDGWELTLRSHIRERFKDGGVVNDYVQVSFVDLKGMTVACVKVMPRGELTFLKLDSRFRLFKRQGNQTVEVTIDQVQEFLNAQVI